MDGAVVKRPPLEAEPSYYESSMQLFWETAELLDMDPRVRLELSEPHHELIFHISVDINNRLIEFDKRDYARRGKDFDDLPASQLDPQHYTILANGNIAVI